MNLRYGKRPDSARTAGRKSKNMSFRTSSLSWCGNLSYSRPRFKIRVIPNQCAHWCGNLPRTADRILKKHVIPNQSADWCGNPPRTTGHVLKSVSFRTSPQTGVGISLVQQTAFSKNVSFRTSAHTGVGIPLVQPDTFRNLCHSEPVRRLVWESPAEQRANIK